MDFEKDLASIYEPFKSLSRSKIQEKSLPQQSIYVNKLSMDQPKINLLSSPAQSANLANPTVINYSQKPNNLQMMGSNLPLQN